MIRLRLRLLCAVLIAASAVVITPAVASALGADRDTIPLGSTRNSVAAIPAAELPDELVYLSSGMTEELLALVRAAAPNVTIISDLDRESALRHAGRAHAVDADLL
ncbi:MAG: hypothetical protein KJO06_06065, partial [Gemmatimonadetes bacterium]|nr:hypothetical protein [Gemmatimonadota bacterium]